MVEYINDRVKEAWNRFAWPECVKVEQRLFRPELSPSAAYSVGDEVYFQDQYFVCIASAGEGNSGWNPQPNLDRYIAYEQAGKSEIVDVLGVYSSNPRTTQVPGPLKYWLSDNGVQVDLGPSKVWVEFTPPAPQFSSNYWSSTTDYNVGDAVFDQPWENSHGTGECYVCISPHKNQQPAKKSPFWELIPFPQVLSTFVRRAVAADMLREDEQMQKAQAEEDAAYEKLEQEYDRIILKQGQYPRFAPSYA